MEIQVQSTFFCKIRTALVLSRCIDVFRQLMKNEHIYKKRFYNFSHAIFIGRRSNIYSDNKSDNVNEQRTSTK